MTYLSTIQNILENLISWILFGIFALLAYHFRNFLGKVLPQKLWSIIKRIFNIEDENKETLKEVKNEISKAENRLGKKIDEKTEEITKKLSEEFTKKLSELTQKPKNKIYLSLNPHPVEKISKREFNTKDKKVLIRVNKKDSIYRATSYDFRITPSYPILEKFLEDSAVKGLRFLSLFKASEKSDDENFKKFAKSEISVLLNRKRSKRVSEWFRIFQNLDSLEYLEKILIPISDELNRQQPTQKIIESFTKFCKSINKDFKDETLRGEFNFIFKYSIEDYKIAFIRIGRKWKIEKLRDRPYLFAMNKMKEEGYSSIFLFSKEDAINNLSSDIAKIFKDTYPDNVDYKPYALGRKGSNQLIHIYIKR